MEKFLNQSIIPQGCTLAIMILAHEQSRDGSVLSTVRMFVRSNPVTIKALEISNQFASLHLQICRLSVLPKFTGSKK